MGFGVGKRPLHCYWYYFKLVILVKETMWQYLPMHKPFGPVIPLVAILRADQVSITSITDYHSFRI